jgi:hypothetical protein
LENEKKFLNITKMRLKNFSKKNKFRSKSRFLFSDVNMSYYQGKYCTEYKKLPLCNPDFIYLDGPGQNNIKKNLNGINLKHKDLMPMSCDILKIEYFLTPGTIILVDGRGANAKFLKDYFKRNWVYKYEKKYDQHVFLLKDPLLGKLNERQIKFYNN